MPHLTGSEINKDDPAFLYLNLHADEEILFIVHHHWAGFLGTLLIIAAMALFPVFALFVANLVFDIAAYFSVVVILLSSYLIFLLTFLFGVWINYYYDLIFITNQRIINVDQEGLLARQTSELTISQVQNATAEVNGFLRSLLNFGDLIIETAGEGTTDNPAVPGLQGYFSIRDIPDPNRIARVILEAHRQYIGDDR